MLLKNILEKMDFTAEDKDSINELNLKYFKRIESLVNAYLSVTDEQPFIPYEEGKRDASYQRAQDFIKDIPEQKVTKRT